jgi:adenosylmethionine-8-amino-7-oxononanoate aminotransferase
MNLVERDRAVIWHPFDHRKTEMPPIPISRGLGSYVYDEQDNRYLDLASSWWVNLHGHAHPEIASAIYTQAKTLEHVMFAGFTHEPAVVLAENLSARLPESLSRFFYSDNGSTAVESALKMAAQYWHNQKNDTRTLFLSFEGGYHGDTFGAMAVGIESGFHEPFRPFLFDVLHVPFPDTWDGDDALHQKEENALAVLDKHLAECGDQIAAFILEPLIQGASGMRMCRPWFVNQVVNRVREHGILVIFDEVMTGFGRTGSLFALDQLEVIPDFLCLSKGITGGFLPLGVTVTSDDIYHIFLNHSARYAFSHGHSYTANPLACAAAIASLRLLCREETKRSWSTLHDAHQTGLSALQMRCAQVVNARCMGTIGAFEVKTAQPDALNAYLKKAFLEQGLLIRPLANSIHLLPPYSTTAEELRDAYTIIGNILCSLEGGLVHQENIQQIENEPA